jgi:hypothetical protein
VELQIEDNEVMDAMTEERTPDFLSEAQTAYPYLKDKELDIVYTPKPKETRFLEFYPPDEPGSPEMPRPKSLPMGRVGIEVFRPNVKPIDILGDYVSHYGVQADPELKKYYGQFRESLDPKVMQERYKYHRENFGETRPFEEWSESSGVPEIFRGYTFNQFGDNAAELYTPQQLMILDQVRKYLGIK